MEQKLKPCPFCNGENIDYSVKTTGRWERKYHVAMYCKDCNCYGKRVLITPTETNRIEIGRNPKYKQLAIDAWNTRKPMERILNRLEEGKTFYKMRSLDQDEIEVGAFIEAIDVVKEGGGIE